MTAGWVHQMQMMCDAHYKHKLPCQRKMFAPSVCACNCSTWSILLINSTVNTKSFKCTVYPTSEVDFATLIKDACCFHAMKSCDTPTVLSLLYDPGAEHKYGAFKRTCLGHLDHPVLDGSTSVIIKQCVYKCRATGVMLPYD